MPVRPMPEGYHTIQPYLVVPDPEGLIAFLQKVLGAELIEKMPGTDGKVRHAEVRIGDSVVMMGRAMNEKPPTRSVIYAYVPEVDGAYQRALATGAKSEMEPVNQFWGDRNAAFIDPAGNSWWLSTHVEDVPPEEIKRRSEEHFRKQGGGA